MRTSFHHQPEAQHPNFQLSASWQADYPIFRRQSGRDVLVLSLSASDPKRTFMSRPRMACTRYEKAKASFLADER